jgi:DNA-binding MarR family transcriptional regulator
MTREQPGRWKFLTNHALVLLCLERRPTARTKDLASWVGITDRAAQRIVADLERDGYLRSRRIGRGKRYAVDRGRRLKHQLHRDRTVDALLRLRPRLPAGEPARS